MLQLVQQVTELVISELLWLNYASPEKPIYLYINSTGGCPGRLRRRCLVLRRAAAVRSAMLPISPAPASAARVGLWLSCPTATCMIVHWPRSSPLPPAGSQTLNGEAVGFETEAYAILATLGYIRPDIYTLVSAPRDEGLAALPALVHFCLLRQLTWRVPLACYWLHADRLCPCPPAWLRGSLRSCRAPPTLCHLHPTHLCLRACPRLPPCRSLARPLATPPCCWRRARRGTAMRCPTRAS